MSRQHFWKPLLRCCPTIISEDWHFWRNIEWPFEAQTDKNQADVIPGVGHILEGVCHGKVNNRYRTEISAHEHMVQRCFNPCLQDYFCLIRKTDGVSVSSLSGWVCVCVHMNASSTEETAGGALCTRWQRVAAAVSGCKKLSSVQFSPCSTPRSCALPFIYLYPFPHPHTARRRCCPPTRVGSGREYFPPTAYLALHSAWAGRHKSKRGRRTCAFNLPLSEDFCGRSDLQGLTTQDLWACLAFSYLLKCIRSTTLKANAVYRVWLSLWCSYRCYKVLKNKIFILPLC